MKTSSSAAINGSLEKSKPNILSMSSFFKKTILKDKNDPVRQFEGFLKSSSSAKKAQNDELEKTGSLKSFVVDF